MAGCRKVGGNQLHMKNTMLGWRWQTAFVKDAIDASLYRADTQVRATSHKPDEIYGIIERLSPGTRKIELFGRPHNVQPNWWVHLYW